MRHFRFEEFDCGGVEGSYVHLQLQGLAQIWFSEMEVYEAMRLTTYDLKVQPSAGVTWRPGDQVLLAPSGKSSREYDSDLRVVKVQGDTIQVRGEMKYPHHGCDTSQHSCWRAAEVASLSRNVWIHGQEGCGESNKCGHFMIAHTNTGYVCGVRFQNLGQTEKEGRYPLHLHLPGDAPDLAIRHNVLDGNRNRGIVLHGANEVLVEANVLYSSKGHLVMLEDAIEMRNRIFKNLARHPAPQNFGCGHSHDMTFACPDRSDGHPNAFWISNPHNYFEGNVGIAPGAAFFMETRHVFGITHREYSGELQRAHLSNGKVKGRVKLLSFKDNLAHSSFIGMGNYPRHWHPDGTPIVYENFTAYSCGYWGQEARGGVFHFRGSRLFDNFAALASGFVNKIYVYDSQLQSSGVKWIQRGLPFVSAPMVVKKLGLSTPRNLRGDFWIDETTKAWTLEHGGYDWDALKQWNGGLGVLFE